MNMKDGLRMDAIATFFPIIFMFSLFFLFILNIITSIWTYRDAMRNGNSKEYALLALIGTLFFPVIGLIVYLIIRKD